MLLKFSNILALGGTAWHLEVGDVSELGGQLVLTRTRRLKLLINNVGSLARAESELRSCLLERFPVLLVRARAWHIHIRLGFETALEFEAHGEAGRGLLRDPLCRVVGATARYVKSLLVPYLGTHVELAPLLVVESHRLDGVVAGGRDFGLVVIHFANVGSETVVGRPALGLLGDGVVLDLGVDSLRSKLGLGTLRRSEAPVRRRLQALVLELVLSWAGDKLVFALLELVMVKGRHGQRRAILAGHLLGRIATGSGCCKLASFGYLGARLSSETVSGSRPLDEVVLRVVARSWNELGHPGVSQVDTAAAAKRVGRGTAILLTRAVLQVVATRAWHTLFNILIDVVSLGVHADLWAISDT